MASSASTSRHQVTITLGRSGKVVKRRAISDIGNDDDIPVLGRKRSVRERLGDTVVDSDSYGNQQRNKRQQTESNISLHGDDVEDRQIGKDDLRLKLMRKGLSQKSNGDAEQNGMDLREKLSRKSKNLPRYDARGRGPESRSIYDARDIPESRSGYNSMGRAPESRDIPESRSGYNSMGRAPESRASTLISQMPSARNADDFRKLDSSRNPYSSWTDDDLRYRSSDKLPSVRRDISAPRSVHRDVSPPRTARRDMPPPRSLRRDPSPPRSFRSEMSPPRTYDQKMRSTPSLTSGGTTRTSSLITRDAPDTWRTRQPYEGRYTIAADTAHPSNGITSSGTFSPTAPAVKEVPLTVPALLTSLGLERYAVLFQTEEVDMAALSQMTDSDLKDMAVPMGPRKKILLAVAPYSKHRNK